MNSREESVKEAVTRGKRGFGTIRRTKSGNFEYRISYMDEFRQRRSKSFTAATVEECLERAEEFRQTKLVGLGTMKPTITVAEILRYKAMIDLEKNHTREQGYSRTIDTIEILERGGIGNMPIADIRPTQLELYLGQITNYSNTVIRKIHGLLRSAFKLAYDAKIIDFNYMLMPEMRCPKSKKADKKIRGLTEEEQKRFLRTLNDHTVPHGRNDYKLQLLIELYSGMRMGEINALRPENIHLDKGYIHVDSTVSTGIEGKRFIKEGAKTYAGTRDVPISRTLRPVLERALGKMRDNPYGLVFYDYLKNDIVGTTQVSNFFRRITEKAGIPVTGQHALRHTFATRCIEAGVPAVVLKKWLGHTNIHITLDTYADVFDRMHFEATDKFDDLMARMSLDESK
jgi:integrase